MIHKYIKGLADSYGSHNTSSIPGPNGGSIWQYPQVLLKKKKKMPLETQIPVENGTGLIIAKGLSFNLNVN